MKHYKLVNDNARDVSFSGEQLAAVSSHSYVGSHQNRWTELKLYRTKGDKLILKIIGRTCWQGESDRHTVVVCADEAALITALEEDNGGVLGNLAKELLETVDVDASEEIG